MTERIRPPLHRLHPDDVANVVAHLPGDLRSTLQSFPVFLGGGFVRDHIAGLEPSDVDLFVPSLDVARDVRNDITGAWAGARTTQSPNAYTIMAPDQPVVQIITRWLYPDPERLVWDFDFTIAMAALWWDRSVGCWRGRAHPSFYQDLAARRLRYTAPDREEDAGGSMLRVLKFARRGYRIAPPELARVLGHLIRGWETEYPGTDHCDPEAIATQITALLREVDPLARIGPTELVPEKPIAVEF